VIQTVKAARATRAATAGVEGGARISDNYSRYHSPECIPVCTFNNLSMEEPNWPR
jgi:hypothetical protein